jgi:hypothetical protein
MITTLINQIDKNNEIKSIRYQSYGRTIRKVLIDNKNNILRDFLYEYNDDHLLESIVLHGKDHVSIAALKKFYYESSGDICKTEEFKYQNGNEIQTQKAIYTYNKSDRTCVITFYGCTDKPLGYAVYGYRKDEEFESLLGCFNMENEKISYFDLDIEKIF